MKPLLTLGFLWFTLFAFSQSKPIYLNKYGFPVINRSEAATYLTVSNDGSSGLYQVSEFYMTDTLKSKGAYSDAELFTREGVFVTYYDNGTVESKITYDGNKARGSAKYWYRNGQLRERRIADGENVQVQLFYDSLGKPMVMNGSGTYIFKDDVDYSATKVTLVGPLKNGKKNGLFTGYVSDSTIYCKEEYEDDRFITGVSYDGEKEFTYKAVMDPEFYERWMSHLKSNIRYPVTARRSGAQGTVWVRLLINDDFTIKEAMVIKSVSKDLDDESVRVLKDTNFKYGPIYKRGQLYTNPTFVAPVKFKLN